MERTAFWEKCSVHFMIWTLAWGLATFFPDSFRPFNDLFDVDEAVPLALSIFLIAATFLTLGAISRKSSEQRAANSFFGKYLGEIESLLLSFSFWFMWSTVVPSPGIESATLFLCTMLCALVAHVIDA